MRLTRVTLFFIALIIGAGFHHLLRQQLDLVEPQVFQATEEAMVDTAQWLAAWIETDLQRGDFDRERLRQAFDAARQRDFEAVIHGHRKSQVGLGAYVTDAKGTVIFDSEGNREGEDYSKLRDVALTLEERYGARSSREDEEDPRSSVMHVGALIRHHGDVWGMVSVVKPQADVLPIVRDRRKGIWWGTGLVGAGILALVAAVFIWQYRPIGRLTAYAREIEQRRRPPLPKLGAGKEVNTLARALESMREALEGRRYAERYVQTLTHEMKSPLAAIRGAAELLDEDMEPSDRQRFLGNIRAETARAERLLNRLLELSALEGRTSIDGSEFELAPVVLRAVDQAKPPADLAGVTLEWERSGEALRVRGDAFILRAAVTNLLENAIDFSPRGSEIRVSLTGNGDRAVITVADRGSGIPAYAKDRVFDRFFSLRHLAAGRKGTGLGLTLVKEAMELHGGRVELSDREGGGTVARLKLPLLT